MIRAPLPLLGDPERDLKLLVTLWHHEGHIIAIKATSKTDLYYGNPDVAIGSVLYLPGNVDCFSDPTVIQPDNQFAVNYDNIQSIAGTMPDDFHGKLVTAIEKSRTIPKNRKPILLGKIKTNGPLV